MCFGQINAHDPFDGFLSSEARDRTRPNRRFVPRNFLLDESVASGRQRSYEASGAMSGFSDFEDWKAAHEDYLDEHVFLNARSTPKTVANAAPRALDPTDQDRCPETFRHDKALETFARMARNLDLVRVEVVREVARIAKVSEGNFARLARAVSEKSASRDEEQELDAQLEQWIFNCDPRPRWAGRWMDVLDLFKSSQRDWPNELRDRFGMIHIDPGQRSPEGIDILVFKYPVCLLPYLRDKRDVRPLAVPSVLDGRFHAAFCPAPDRQPTGYSVSLRRDGKKSCCELLHPAVLLKSDHLYRFGTVTRPAPRDLTPPRRDHLRWLRNKTGRYDYAQETDGDIL